jgi:hypothetical protein
MEYFCNQGDSLWSLPDEDMKRLAIDELGAIGVADKNDLLDSCVIRVEKAYPAYFGAYNRFAEVRSFLDGIPNLYPVGRNGMHRYNNLDHSMLSAMEAVNCIVSGATDKGSIWSVNTEQEYHEEKSFQPEPRPVPDPKTNGKRRPSPARPPREAPETSGIRQPAATFFGAIRLAKYRNGVSMIATTSLNT